MDFFVTSVNGILDIAQVEVLTLSLLGEVFQNVFISKAHMLVSGTR